jgi:hypothetical protein
MKDVYYWLRTGTKRTQNLVQFHFYNDGNREMVEIVIYQSDSVHHVFVELWEFCRDMFPISEEAAVRSKQ